MSIGGDAFTNAQLNTEGGVFPSVNVATDAVFNTKDWNTKHIAAPDKHVYLQWCLAIVKEHKTATWYIRKYENSA